MLSYYTAQMENTINTDQHAPCGPCLSYGHAVTLSIQGQHMGGHVVHHLTSADRVLVRTWEKIGGTFRHWCDLSDLQFGPEAPSA